MSYEQALTRLADLAGILATYRSITGQSVATGSDSRAALLAAMGYDTSTELSLHGEVDRLLHERRDQIIEPVEVLPVRSPAARRLRVRLPDSLAAGAKLHVELKRESEPPSAVETRIIFRRGCAVTLELPTDLEPGYHDITVRVFRGRRDVAASQRRIIHPPRCRSVSDVLEDRRAFGIWLNLYTLKSRRNHGIGDLSDLASVADWARRQGAEFVGVNPLHSLRNRETDISPYSPASRLFHNELYLDVAAVPEFAHCAEARRNAESADLHTELEQLRSSDRVLYESVSSLKLKILRMLFTTLVDRRHQCADRYDAFLEYKKHGGSNLVIYATYRALQDHLLGRGYSPNWHTWPESLRRPDSPEVSRFSREHAAQIDFYCFLQWEFDRQLGAVAGAARTSMALGLYGDVALGSDPNGPDSWAHQDLFVEGAHMGAPPDDFAPAGQDWGLAPLDPGKLRASRYEYWIRILRANARHMGALRLDHVMGLFRQFWIPRDSPGTAGAYVMCPARDLLGILALESDRSGTVIVGEDLGTVPPGLQSRLARWGILSSRVLYFERNRRGSFKPAGAYSGRAMVTAHTHDQAPLQGYWTARDLELRREAGAYATAADLERAVADRGEAKEALCRRLSDVRGCKEADIRRGGATLVRAVYGFLARTPAPLLGVSLDDLAGERDPVNLPGVSVLRSRSWSRRMRVALEDLTEDRTVDAALADVVRLRARDGGGSI